MAEAWERLIEGNFTQNDMRLLEHEFFELRFEQWFRTDLDTAHRIADKHKKWDPKKLK